ncbi:DUF416 family protein [Cellulomonas sp. Sa3CUA2]|uniref:DUF416 family protein n=1 Tax=Cellulomonas avistercoris TaxID=2762242 RepID=A0ABR8QEH3_9CELL|nr:DUF416 family protein [Cellulomonas avistercoris]MBD7918829.1 DUF416 family protein [Cellulomonas avistercoris]
MQDYDEEWLLAESCRIDRSARTAFAAACAELLWPVVERYAAAVSLPAERLEVLRGSLDAVWDALDGVDADVAAARATAESMVPFDGDEDWVMEAGYAQSAIAAVVYAARSWLTDDPQEAVWAARQVYEAADYAAQHADGRAVMVYSADVEDELRTATVVRAATRAVAEWLDQAATHSPSTVRRSVRAESRAFAGLFA